MTDNSTMVAYLGLGSNLGDRAAQLSAAVTALGRHGVSVLRTASLYFTEPRDVVDQPWFLNTVAEASTQLNPFELLHVCLQIEQDAGRIRDQLKGPRPIDIDILLYGTHVIRAADLVVPHPRYAERRFVLVPLVELQPDLIDPRRNLTVTQLLNACQDAGRVRRYAPPLI